MSIFIIDRNRNRANPMASVSNRSVTTGQSGGFHITFSGQRGSNEYLSGRNHSSLFGGTDSELDCVDHPYSSIDQTTTTTTVITPSKLFANIGSLTRHSGIKWIEKRNISMKHIYYYYWDNYQFRQTVQ